MRNPTEAEINAALIKPFEADLKGMSLAQMKNALQFAQDIVDQEEPWIEALSAAIQIAETSTAGASS